MHISTTLAAGIGQEYTEAADFFRVLDCAVSDLVVRFYKDGREVGNVANVTAGYGEKFTKETFDRVRIQSATGGAVSFVMRLGNDVSYDKPPTGAVTVSSLTPTRAAATQAAQTVTNASAQLLAAKANRSYLLIQNKDAAGSIFLNLAGAAATVVNGVKIPPGGSLELNCNLLTGAVFAIGDIPSNANIVTVEA